MHKNKRIQLDKENPQNQNTTKKISKDISRFGTFYKNRIFGFKFSIKEIIEELENLEFPFFYALKENKFFYDENIFNAFVKKETENLFILSNGKEIKKENVNTEILKKLKRNELFNKKRYNEIVNSNKLLENVVYAFRCINNEIFLHDYSVLGIGYKLKGKVFNNYIKTAEGKFRCIFLQNHENKEIIDAECFEINNFKEEIVFKEFTEIREFIQTFKIQKIIGEHKYLCISKKLKGILISDVEKKVGDIVKCSCKINESGIFLRIYKEEEEDSAMAIDFNKEEVESEHETKEKSYAALLHENISYMQLHDKMDYIMQQLEEEDKNDKQILDLLTAYFVSSSDKKKGLTKLLVFLDRKKKESLKKEFLKKIHKENLFSENLINIFLKENILKPILLFYFENKNKKNIIELLKKDYALLNFLYETKDYNYIRNVVEQLLKECSDFQVYKFYLMNEIKHKNFNYAENIFERTFEIKFKKSCAKKLCEMYLKFKTENSKDGDLEDFQKTCEDYFNKFYL